MKVVVLAGGASNEREVSQRSGQAVVMALDSLGYACELVDPAADGYDLAQATAGSDVVFIALHGEGGEDGTIQAELDALGLPYVGTDAQASALCFDKWQYKRRLLEAGLPASAGQMVTIDDLDSDIFDRPYVLKPARGGSSLDTLIARSPADVRQRAADLLEKYPSLLLEPLIVGTEITVGIYGDTPLPVIEIVPPAGKEFDYENKYNGATRELCPPESVTAAAQARAQQLALQIHQLTGCQDISRTDMILDGAGTLHVLETNTIPGFTQTSLYPKMLQTAGYSFAEAIDMLLQRAAMR